MKKAAVILIAAAIVVTLTGGFMPADIVATAPDDMPEYSLSDPLYPENYDAAAYADNIAMQKLPDSDAFQDSDLFKLKITGYSDFSAAYEILDLLNSHREANGRKPVKMDRELLKAAMLRAAECAVYYSHTRPDGTSCFTAFPPVSGKHSFAENIAIGYKSPAEVMNGWRNSSGHNTNMLNADYVSVGIGCFKNSDGTWSWVQCFSAAKANEEPAKTLGGLQETYSITAAYSCLQGYLYISEGETTLMIGDTTVFSLYIKNKGYQYTTPKIHFTEALAEDRSLVDVIILSDGMAHVTAVNEPGGHIGVGLASTKYSTGLGNSYFITVKAVEDGDINADGIINVSDGVIMQRILAGLEPKGKYSDLNADGVMTVADGVIMQRILAGLE